MGGDDGSGCVRGMCWSLCHSQESGVTQKGPLPTDFPFEKWCSHSHHALAQKCVKTTYNAQKAALFKVSWSSHPL